VILHLYEEKGLDLVEELEGMFAFALVDEWRQTVLLARDRLGQKPLHYGFTRDGFLVFGSELQALLTVPTLPRDPKHPEDLDTRAEDHVADELRYALMHLYRPHMKARSQGRDPFLGSNLLDSLTVARAGRRPAGRVA